jgi:hypothetical protein
MNEAFFLLSISHYPKENIHLLIHKDISSHPSLPPPQSEKEMATIEGTMRSGFIYCHLPNIGSLLEIPQEALRHRGDLVIPALPGFAHPELSEHFMVKCLPFFQLAVPPPHRVNRSPSPTTLGCVTGDREHH